MAKPKTAITPTRDENYPEWYQQVVRAAELAESSPVRGCMVIKPWGYSLWEGIQRSLDQRFKATGHKNAYFPIFIPKSFLEKEAEHVDGFAKECAVVTHHRLEAGPDGGLVPAGELDEPLIVRPTSETIIGAMFSKWVESYRDLPLLINQWANVVRWEMRTRMFLRTTEFLWQEGHTVHVDEADARREVMQMLECYRDFVESEMAMPVICGAKSAGERFPGAIDTYTIEAMMQDRKALQAGTSHYLGENFSRAADIRYLDENGERVYAHTTSWGVSTRLIGGLVMTHGDDDGLAVPPRLAPVHVVILPITFKSDDPERIMNYCHKLADDLRVQDFHGRRIEVEIDDRDLRGGEKTWSWIKRGAPIRLEIGPRDMEADSVFMGRRDLGVKEKTSMPRQEFVDRATEILDAIQSSMFDRAVAFRDEHTKVIDSEDDFRDWFAAPAVAPGEPTPAHAGFAMSHWNGDPEIEKRINDELGVTIRCIPLDDADGPGTCPFSGGTSAQRVVWAKSY
ncbi:MAG: proline--tRNA ligase [Phycisphaerales bacterium]